MNVRNCRKRLLDFRSSRQRRLDLSPQTKDVKANRSAFRKGEITRQEYVDFNKKKIAECVAWQEEIGLDVLVHGEYERNDMVEYFGEALGGFLLQKKPGYSLTEPDA